MNVHKGVLALFTKDAAKSREFYEKVMGFTVVANFGDTNIVYKEGFAIWQVLDDNIIIKTLGRGIYTQNLPRFELSFETGDILADYAMLKANNVKFLHEMNEEIWGQRTIRFYDPDGHLLEIGEAMPIFLRRIYNEEGQNLEATAKRTFTPLDLLKQYLGM